MDEIPQQLPSTERIITTPHNKLQRLCAEAASRGGRLTKPVRVAEALGVSRGRISQNFGSNKNRNAVGVVIDAATVGRIVALFRADGVPCEIEWFYLDYAEFVANLIAAGPTNGGVPSPQWSVEPPTATEWQRGEYTVLTDLVELRLHPPRPANEVPNSYFIDATLLFGTAVLDYRPNGGEEPRSVAIALRDARLTTIGSEAYQPLRGTMLGEPGREFEYLERLAGGIEITGPRAEDGTLKGDPLGDQHLAIVAGTNTGDEVFAVNIVVPNGSFEVTDPDRPPSVGKRDPGAVNRNAILNQFIYKRCIKGDSRLPSTLS